MSSGLQIVAIGGKQSVSAVLKVWYTGLLSTALGWHCSRLVSLLARRSRPSSVLLNAGRCECLWRDLALLLFVEEGFGELPEDNSSFFGISALSGMMSFFPLLRAVGCFACPLSCGSPSPRLCFFSIWARRRSFSRCRCSVRSCSSLIRLACFFFFFSIS